jgi:hypothetical protein
MTGEVPRRTSGWKDGRHASARALRWHIGARRGGDKREFLAIDMNKI